MFIGKSKKGILAIVVIVIISGSFIVISQNSRNDRVEISSPSGLKEKPRDLKIPPPKANRQDPEEKEDIPSGIPTDVTYRQIFKHIAELNRKADKGEQNGKDDDKLRNLYKKMARLDEKQARTLDRIADKTNRDLQKLDNRAKEIITQIRSQTPNRRLEQGQKVPLPPQELFDLSKQRKDVTLAAVEELRENFGMAEFVRFNKFIKDKVKPGIQKKGNGAEIQRGGTQR